MTRELSDGAKRLLHNARSLEDAAALIAAAKSTFGKCAVPGLLPEQGTAVLYGQSGSGKSFLAVYLALCLSAGLPWFGEKVRSGLVIYLASEDRAGIEARAVAAASRMEGVSIPGLPLKFLTPPPIHSDQWHELTRALAELQLLQEAKITAVVLDTMGAAFGGNSQDDAAQMTIATDRAQGIAERFGCLFLLIHHSGKDQFRGMRGSQVLKDRSDVVIALSKQRSGLITASIEKQRNGSPDEPITFRLRPVSVAIGEQTIETCTIGDLARGAPARAAVPLAEARADTAARSGQAEKLPKGDTLLVLEALRALSNGEASTIKAWRAKSYEAFGERENDAKRQAFNTAKTRLLKEFSLISIHGDTVRFFA